MKLAIFDFDGTLFPKDTLPFMLARSKYLKCPRLEFYRIYLSMLPLYVQYKMGWGKMTSEQMKFRSVCKFNYIFDGMAQKDIEDFFQVCAREAAEFFHPAVLQEIEKARNEGFHTVLLSGAYEPFLRSIGEDLRFDTIIGSPMCYRSGVFDARPLPEVVIGGQKCVRLQEHFQGQEIEWEASRAYADSHADLDLLQLVGSPTAVNPDKELKSVALGENWRILAD